MNSVRRLLAGEYGEIEYGWLPEGCQRFSTPSSSRIASALLVMRVSDRPELKARDSYEVGWIACVERQRVRDRTRRDERVIRSRRRFAP